MDYEIMSEHSVVVGRNGKKVFHENFCPYALKIKEENRLFSDERHAKKDGYRECAFCRSVKGLVYKYRKSGFDTFYDPVDNAVCIRTEVGFWKAIWMDDSEDWKLFHLNRGDFDPKVRPSVLMRRRFHRQKDVPQTESLAHIVMYIRRHDKDMKTYDGDYHKMPRQTPKQRKYYKHAKNRAKKKSVRNVYKILDQIKMEEK